MGMKHHRHSDKITRSKRWKALRLRVLRRDGWRCQDCGGPGHEVDHKLPVRSHPELAWDESNLQTLCGGCHSRKTRLECGHPPLTPQRQEWRDLLKGNCHVGLS